MNEPAFPNEGFSGWGEPFKGMTLRDYFAARAMPVALKTLMHAYVKDDKNWYWEGEIDNDILAELSYEMADAMLKASIKQELI